LRRERGSAGVVLPGLPVVADFSEGGWMRTVGIDVHKRFAEVAVVEDGEVGRLGRIAIEQLGAFAASLRATTTWSSSRPP
jgi:hypothetical protein